MNAALRELNRSPSISMLLTEKTAAPSIAELIEIIGAEAAIQLCDAFGGHSREIGKPAFAIVEAIGIDAARALRNYWGRGRIYIPRRILSPKARHAEVARLRRGGMTIQAIAGQMRLSERQVYTILARAGIRADQKALAG